METFGTIGPKGFNQFAKKNPRALTSLKQLIRSLCREKNGITTAQPGLDLLAAKIMMEEKIPYTIVLISPDQRSTVSLLDRITFDTVLDRAEKVETLYPRSFPEGCHQHQADKVTELLLEGTCPLLVSVLQKGKKKTRTQRKREREIKKGKGIVIPWEN